MSRLVIVGGGFAGVWSAAGAALARGDRELSVTVVAPGADLVLRPRLYEAEPERATVALHRILRPIDVGHVRRSVREIDDDARTVLLDDGTSLRYDRLVLAAGSRVVRPSFPGAERLFDVDTLDGATRLAERLRALPSFTAVVVGAGFTGVELATELAGRGRVVLVERADVVGPELGPGPRPAIEAALAHTGVDVRLGASVTEVGDGRVRLADGSGVDADVTVWTAGLRASPLTEDVPAARDPLGRLYTDRHLRVTGTVFAAGDTAAAPFDAEHTTIQSCQHATPTGKTAGYNAAADLLGLPAVEFDPAPYVTDVDLGAAGAVLTRGWDRRVESDGADGKLVKRWLMKRIEPPTDDRERILRAAGRIHNAVPTVGEIRAG